MLRSTVAGALTFWTEVESGDNGSAMLSYVSNTPGNVFEAPQWESARMYSESSCCRMASREKSSNVNISLVSGTHFRSNNQRRTIAAN